ncbi:LLM class oxidoreductase [Inquilinus limosus]|uniref:LLM class oxidoreductase n=1 Tax=Inquilinus limosus TaxID=171674 RepID=UPI00041B24C6|nr:LLM class oxidoreductase [Inquilinus limosus]
MTSHMEGSALDLIRRPRGLTLGIELPLDNDWSPMDEAARRADGRPFGVPDLARHADRVRQVDRSGFAAIWMRDVPVFDPQRFGDAGSVYDVFAHLGFLAGITKTVALGTAAVVLPLRHPMMTAKAAASVDALSGGRLILGVATGDRPVEFPLLGLDFEGRGEAFRDAVSYIRQAWQPGGLPLGDGTRAPTLDLLPRPAQPTIPLVMAGRGRQSLEWIGEQMDGWFVYPNTPELLAAQAQQWHRRHEARRPFISAFHLDLAEDPDAAPQPHRFGARLGRNRLVEHLRHLAALGVDHLALHLRHSRRPVEEVLDELAREILPQVQQPLRPAADAAE